MDPNTITNFILGAWLLPYMTSPMMFAAPGSSNNIKAYSLALVVLYYPCYLFLVYSLFGWSYYGYSAPFSFAASFTVISLLCFPYATSLIKLKRGILIEGYSKTSKNAYYNAQPIITDLASFTILPQNSAVQYSEHYGNYAADKHNVYLNGYTLKDADPATFSKAADKLELWADKNYVFYEGDVVESAIPKSISVIYENEDYWRTATQLFFRNRFLEAIEENTSPYLVGKYLASNNRVFYRGEKVYNAEPRSLKRIDDSEENAADKNQVYYHGKVIHGADPNSFKRLNTYIAKDGTDVYKETETLKVPETLDANRFTLFESYLGEDDHNVYLIDQSHIETVAEKNFMPVKYLKNSYILIGGDIYCAHPGNTPKVVKVDASNVETFHVMNDEQANKHKYKYDAQDDRNFYKSGKKMSGTQEP